MFDRQVSKLLREFYIRPILPFTLQLVILAPLILATDIRAITSVYILLLPWFSILLAILNFPILYLAFSSFKRDLQTRRNHMLEHATILMLQDAGHEKISGSASRNGFRISGVPSSKEIQMAFEKVRKQLVENKPVNYVSARCGPNRIIALGFGLILLFALSIASIAFHPAWLTRAIALVGVVLIFTILRHFFGNWFQKRLFMATDFKKVSLREVRKIRTRIWDRSPTYFVETIIHGV